MLLDRDLLPNLTTHLKHLARESGSYTIVQIRPDS